MMARAPFALALGLAALALTPGVAHAQAKKPNATPQPSQAQMKRAASNFSVLIGALQSKEVPQVVKEVLFVCAYSNPFSKISENTDKALAQKKVDQNNPQNVAGAMAAVCGLKPDMLKAPPKK